MIELPIRLLHAERVRLKTRRDIAGAKPGSSCVRVYLGGEGFYLSAAGRLELRPGLIGVFLRGGGGVQTNEPGRPFSYLYCKFTGGYAEWLAGELVKRAGSPLFEFARFDELAAVVRSACEAWSRNASRPRPELMTEADAHLARALAMLAGEPDAGRARRSRLDAEALESFLEERLQAPCDLDAFAEELGLAKSSLVRKARELCGESVQRMHERMKMDLAKVLLSSGDAPVSGIAAQLGYADPLYFSRAFRKRAGASPSEWRRAARAGQA